MQASAAGQKLAAAIASLTERAPDIVDVDANAAIGVLPAALAAFRAAQRQRCSERQLRVAAGRLLGTQAENIVWTAGGTEADVLALIGTLNPGDHLVTSPIEHSAVSALTQHLQAHHGITHTTLALADGGVVDIGRLHDVIVPGVRLVSCMAANNETGVLQPLEAIAQRCAEIGALLHVDAVQAFGRVLHRTFLQLPGRTLVALAGHKLGAVGHTGILRLQGVTLQDALGLRARAPIADDAHIAGYASLVAALESFGEGTPSEALTARVDETEREILAMVPGARIIGAGNPRLNNTSCIFLPGMEAEAVLMGLDARGICIGAGSACNSGSTEPSPTLLAMGLSVSDARCCIRLSWPHSMTAQQAKSLLEALGEVVSYLRSSKL